jgi:hypothetical protein
MPPTPGLTDAPRHHAWTKRRKETRTEAIEIHKALGDGARGELNRQVGIPTPARQQSSLAGHGGTLDNR